ncbi:hypothetical protein [Streptomyces tsukubensis]|uniref:Uncharacterized protein n=1 Tax=Streptomyces tsukubensis TaxID=83656 RepID=A0A1V4A6B1_9ACTN|nr:hypothetical protein [Streptomyces tsukubensis]OON77298.1 hypothetical protein B1H18_18800 [Streptomyces tsukubensis]QFR92373.1 hypothetical protein GBW32_04025 [Streptomyces tsukubensis]
MMKSAQDLTNTAILLRDEALEHAQLDPGEIAFVQIAATVALAQSNIELAAALRGLSQSRSSTSGE